LGPFDACAYELALSQKNAEVTLLSLGPESVAGALRQLTRLGAKEAVLLRDPAFAGSDTLATAYALSLAVQRLCPDLVFCGRQTLVGDTSQTPVMLAEMAGYSLITGVMGISEITEDRITCETREEGTVTANLAALITVERINRLRLPSLRSKVRELHIWSAQDLQADPAKCGLLGSPTRVVNTQENVSGSRKCRFITREELPEVIEAARQKQRQKTELASSEEKLGKVLCITEAPMEYARSVSEQIVVCPQSDPKSVIAAITSEQPEAVLFANDCVSKRTAALVAARLGLGLCADCTALAVEDHALMMIRPALSGSVIASVRSLTSPAMATVRTGRSSSDIVVTAGFGVRDHLDEVRAFAEKIGAELGATRKMVDNGFLPYEFQVGLTGKKVSPSVYIAIGVSGAVHHIVGMDQSTTVIAVNPDREAPIFDYADYGVLGTFDI